MADLCVVRALEHVGLLSHGVKYVEGGEKSGRQRDVEMAGDKRVKKSGRQKEGKEVFVNGEMSWEERGGVLVW